MHIARFPFFAYFLFTFKWKRIPFHSCYTFHCTYFIIIIIKKYVLSIVCNKIATIFFFFLSLSLSPILLLLRHAGLFSSLFVPWWRTFATYAADTPLDTSCTILDLLISRPECTDAHTGMRSGAAHRLACAHARTRYTKGSSPFREMIFNNRPTGKCEKVQCVHLVSR